MPTIPFRNVGEKGVVFDKSPQDADPMAWTDARNVRFAEGKISRYSVFKRLDDTYTYSIHPVGIIDASSVGNEGVIVTVFSDGSMSQFDSGAVTDVTHAAFRDPANRSQITTCKLGNITYVNRETDAPCYRENPNDGAFLTLTGWAANDRCKALRSYKDFLIALNTTVGGTDYPTMVKWSDAVQAGVPPSNWNTTDPASLAGETVLNGLSSPIIDGLSLGDSFLIYTDREVVRMDFVGQPFIFAFNTVFNENSGMITKNCAVEVEGKHYVFGRDDIYVHDGVSRMSLVDGVIRQKVFDELDFTNRDRCFVYHDFPSNEVGFCYPTVADDAKWRGSDVLGCNRAVVFNYRWNTWTVVDLPSVTGCVATSASSSTNFEDTGTWSGFDSTWGSTNDIARKNLLFASSGNPVISKTGRPFFLDKAKGGRLSNSTDPDIYWEAYAEKVMQDMDELGVPLMSMKSLGRIVPQVATADTDQTVQFQFGASLKLGNDMAFTDRMTFNPWTQYKVDVRAVGRYLGLRFIIPEAVGADFGGFDADIQVISRR